MNKIIKIIPVLVSVVLLAACFEPSNAPTCTIQCATDGDCVGGQTCGAGNLCTDGANCTEPDMCTSGQFIACVSGAARSCNATGDGTEDASCGAPGCNDTARRCNACLPDELSCAAGDTAVEQCMADGSARMMTDQCAAGCAAASGTVAPHCKYLSPVWLPDICDTVATVDSYVPNASATITTTLDTNCPGGVIAQTGGAPICVVRAKTITIPSAVTLSLQGTRPIAYVADTQLDVLGTLDASADRQTSGAGGTRVSGAAGTSTSAGGGSGFGTAGGVGGNGGAAGPALDPITLAAFGGGSHPAGSSSMVFDFTPNAGGAGGGVLLIACRGQVKVSGTIDVGGGGGAPSYDTVQGAGVQLSKAAAGGGSGGYVVIQGLTVTVDGQLWANGGGGGGGNTIDEGNATAGSDALRSTSQTGGGSSAGVGGGGGRGGGLGTLPTGGVTSTVASGGGGGGGAVGILQIYAPTGVTPVVTGAITSPAFTAKKTSTLR